MLTVNLFKNDTHVTRVFELQRAGQCELVLVGKRPTAGVDEVGCTLTLSPDPVGKSMRVQV